jgi:hypothetical protein
VSAVTPRPSAAQPAGDALPPPPAGRWRAALRLAVAGVFLAVVAVVLAGQWRQARPLLGRLSVQVVLAAWALVLAWSGAAVVAERRLVRPPGPRRP